MVDRIDQHNAASLKYPLRDDKTQKNEITQKNEPSMVLWDEAFGADSKTTKNVQGNSLFETAKSQPVIENFDFSGLSGLTKQAPKEDVQIPFASTPEVAPEAKAPAAENPKVATCDFDTHPKSCDEPAIELPKPPESKYCDFDTHPNSCDEEPVAPTSIKTYVKEGDTLSKYAKSLYGTTSPEVLKAIADANPDAVKQVKTGEGKVDYRLSYDPKHLKELSLPYVIETPKATYATNDAFMPE